MDATPLPGFSFSPRAGTAATDPSLTHLDATGASENRSPETALEQAFPRWPAERRTALVSQVRRRRTQVLTLEDEDFPIASDIPGCPSVLFVEGRRPGVLRAPRVAVVGTRAASVHGLTDAWELGAFLGAAGIAVVSGLAIGIDGAAHHGALQAAEVSEQRGELTVAGPVGVVATGL